MVEKCKIFGTISAIFMRETANFKSTGEKKLYFQVGLEIRFKIFWIDWTWWKMQNFWHHFAHFHKKHQRESMGKKKIIFKVGLEICFKRLWIEWTWWKNAKFSVTFDPRWITSQSWTRLKEISWFNIVTKDFPFCPSFFLESNKFHVKILQVRFMGIHRDATPLWINGYKWSGVCLCLCVCVLSPPEQQATTTTTTADNGCCVFQSTDGLG